jgi:Flp pilus assembly protein TadG
MILRTSNSGSRFRTQVQRLGRNQLKRTAAATVELAVLLPFLVLMFLGIVDFGRLFYHSMTVQNALHNAMLFAGQTFDNQNQQWIGNNQYWQGPGGQVSATGDAAGMDGSYMTPPLDTTQVTTATGTDANGNSVVIVTVSYTFQTLVPYPGIPSQVQIQRSAQIRVAPAVPGS